MVRKKSIFLYYNVKAVFIFCFKYFKFSLKEARMDPLVKRILIFLRKNSHLDLEIPDIAFHLKINEPIVQHSLKLLYRNKLVTAKKNEYGRVFWYAVSGESKTQAHESENTENLPKTGKFDSLSETNNFPPAKLTFLVSIILAVVCGILGTKIYFNSKLKSESVSISQETVSLNEYLKFRRNASQKVLSLELEVKSLNSRVDSLRALIGSLNSKTNENGTSSYRVHKRRY